MAETDVIIEEKKPEQVQEAVIKVSPFAGTSWVENEPKKEEPVILDKKPDTPAATKKEEDDVEILEPNDWFKGQFNEFGWENVEKAKADISDWKKAKDSPTAAEIKYANDQSKLIHEALLAGKEDEVLAYLSNKKQIEKFSNLNVENPKEASELLKTYYKFKYKDFSDDDVHGYFQDQYEKPEKPKQTADQEDSDYQEILDKWKVRCDAIDRKMIRDAKMAKPDFTQFNSQVVLPQIPKQEQKAQEPSQELLAAQKAARENFLQKLESDYAKADGFTTQVKDESVEIPVSFKIPDESKAAIKARLQDGFDLNEFMDKRWFDDKGSPKIEQIISDIFQLENPDKILSGIANNAANQRLVEFKKAIKHIDLNGKTHQETFKPEQNGNPKVTPFSKGAWSETPIRQN